MSAFAAGATSRELLVAEYHALREFPRLSYFDRSPHLQACLRGTYTRARAAVATWDLRPAPPSQAVLDQAARRSQRIGGGRHRARLIVLDVVGDWHALVAPGLAACSSSALSNTDELVALVSDSFISARRAGTAASRLAAERPSSPVPAGIHAPLQPFVTLRTPEFELTADTLTAFPDGFELRLRRRSLRPEPEDAERSWREWCRGLSVQLEYSDGRRGGIADLSSQDERSDITVGRFNRPEDGSNVVTLFVAPLPPPGDVVLTASFRPGGQAHSSRFPASLVLTEAAGG